MKENLKKFTYCRICEGSCGFVSEVEGNKLVKYYPDREHPVSKGYSCIKGRHMINIQNHPKLLKYPLKKIDGSFKRISWEQTIDEIGQTFLELKNNYGPDSIGLYFGNPTAFSYSATIYSAAFMKFMGSRNLYSAGSQDCNNKFAHSKRFYGSSLIIVVPDFENIDYLLALGTNPAASHFSFVVFPRPMQRLKQMEKRGCKIVWINPRYTEAAKKVGKHYFIKPNTDIFLLFGMVNYILENNLEDTEFINTYSKGIEELRKIAKEFGGDLDEVERITKIKKETIINITKSFLAASKKGGASVYGRAGTDRGSFATLLAWLIDVLNFITGNLDKKGNFYSYGLIDAVEITKMGGIGSSKKSKKKKYLSRIGEFSTVMGTYPAALMADEILTPGEGQIRGMIVMAGDPLVSCPNTIKLKKAYENLDVLVSIDFFINDTGTISDYILPATTFLEREDFMLTTSSFNPIPYCNYTDAILEPGSERKPEWEIFNLLSEKMGIVKLGGPPIKTFQYTLSRKDRKTFRKLIKSEKGIWLNEEKKIQYNTLLPDRIQHSDKLIHLMPSDYYGEFEKLRTWKGVDDDHFSIISGRQIETINSWIHARGDTNYCYISSKDARRLGVEDHQEILVSTEIGSIKIPVKISSDLLEGVIWLPHGWGRTVKDVPDIAIEKKGINVNKITNDNWKGLETFAGMAFLDGFPANIEKIKD
ncbi:MAG: molybdopterin-dependent oxidoreductase [Candidatus Lokiarchaeota archaeon]|nr:molybdopterin-dependent oxidoreductase [Candidatus Lokiarchaeota archaeon]